MNTFIKAIIVDDQTDAIEMLQWKLEKTQLNIKISATATTIEEAYKVIIEHQPELVFLDINLGDQTSFELLDLFDTIFFKIIFITGHDEYAIKAIKHAALDYILKPPSVTELITAIQKAQKSLANEQNYQLLKEQLNSKSTDPEKIIIDTGSKTFLVTIKEIVRCEVSDNYVTIHLINTAPILVIMQLKNVEALLPPTGFIKPHRSHLVNKDYILSIDKSKNCILLTDQTEIPISLARKKTLLKHFF